MKIFPRQRLELQQKGNLVGAVTTKLGGRIIVMDGDQHMMVTGSVAAANIYECGSCSFFAHANLFFLQDSW